MNYYSKGDEGFDKYSMAVGSICTSNTPFSDRDYIRSAFDFEDYEFHRPCAKMPETHRDIVRECQKVYKTTGLIRNIIDLMSDFSTQGVRISHVNERTEMFFQSWFNRIGGPSITERFANSLFKNGSVVIRKRNAKLSVSDRRKLYKAMAEEIVDVKHLKTNKNLIPYEYNFLNPATVELVGGAMAVFANQKQYKIVIPESFSYSLYYNEDYKEIINTLPDDLRDSYQTGKEILLSPDNTIVYHYKKDDWEEWPTPIIFSILRDIQILNRMKLADLSALDGAINNLRIIKLGSLQEHIWPEEAAFGKLASMLAQNTSAGVREFVWGPDIELIETQSTAHQFLGDNKYVPTLNAIYAGVGIPPTLTGTDKSSGTTNNLISLKTLIRRLEYCRTLIIDFWTKEIEIVRQAMGFSSPAVIEFDNNNLGEEEAEKKLWIELAEKNIVSDEIVIRKFGANPKLENARVNREEKQRKNSKRPKKAGQFHNPQIEENIKKYLIQRGQVDIKDLDKDINDIVIKDLPEMPKDAGRPPNSKDVSPRKKRTVKPVSKAGLRIWADQTQARINEVTVPIFLAHFNKKNMRSLSSTEASIAEDVKFGVLLNIEPMSNISDEHILSLVGSNIDNGLYAEYQNLLSSTKQELARELTINDIRSVQLDLYMEIK